MRDVVLVSSLELAIEHFARGSDGDWHYRAYGSRGDTLHLSNLACDIALKDVYDRVHFENETA